MFCLFCYNYKLLHSQVRKGDKQGMKKYANQMHKQIDDLVTTIQTPLSKNKRKKFNTGDLCSSQ